MVEEFAAHSITKKQNDAWFPDSTALQLMTSDGSKLESSIPYFGSDNFKCHSYR
jgi:hypothetical protein